MFIFQEYSQKLYEHVNTLGTHYIAVDKSEDTLIMAKKKKFSGKPQDISQGLSKMTPEIRKQL